jgi:hypothetical protein
MGMGTRSWLALALCAIVGCGGNKDDKPESDPVTPLGAAAADADKQCLQLAKLCGDKSKHVDKIVEECKTATKKHADKGCTAKATAAYDCYQRELCGKSEKVWSLGDLGVLADRHKTCVTERNALRTCAGE